MASIVLSSLGQAAGAATGLPLGGAFGRLLGGVLGARVAGSARSHFEGARLEDLAVQTSTYGRMIAQVYGTVRISGNLIWARPIRETATTTTTSASGSGKGGSRSVSSSSTTYSYDASMAIAICEGEITRVERIYADSKLLDLSQYTLRIYRGGESQLPDPLIEGFEGVGNTPAYRGLAYVVFENFPLADYGNRLPNFTFEVTRRVTQQDAQEGSAESLVRALMLLPGSGEFVYDTTVVYKVAGVSGAGGFTASDYQIALNRHTAEGQANALVAIDRMIETFPNLEWVGLVANWFGTQMDIASCEIWPSVEYQSGANTTPVAWSVAGLTRGSARQIGQDNGQLRYGGTPDDGSLLRLIDALKSRGLKVFFYPMLLMDIAGKPWRGELTGSAANVANFFTRPRGYNAFVLHYAQLVAGRADAFAIGTELRDLTKISSAPGVYPAVDQLIALASSVKAILGAGCKVTYAADWSEYHHTDGGWHHLDPLWASAAIDCVGIDAYFPLADAPQTGYDIAAIRAGWTSGEGYDWYYADADRTTRASLSPEYAWKNIDWWWRNTHRNPDGASTPWVPMSKPIWFTEYGFASVDGCINEPNVFIDATSATSGYPRFSRGRIDFMAQRAAIVATELEWADNSMLPLKFLWAWDARPYPYWPDLSVVWADGASWVTGHWVQGKLGASHVGAVAAELLTRAGLSPDQIDTRQVQYVLEGFVLHDRVTARAALTQLMQAYFFSAKESDGKIVLLPRDSSQDAQVSALDCVSMRSGAQEVAYTVTRKENLVLPHRIEVQYLNRLQRYETAVAAANRETDEGSEQETVRLSLVLSAAHAQAIAEGLLTDRWSERTTLSFQLPMAQAALEPGDLIRLEDDTRAYDVRVTRVQIGKPGLVKIDGTLDASTLQDLYLPPVEGGSGGSVSPTPLTRLEIIDSAALPGDNPNAVVLRLAASGLGPNWRGASIFRVLPGGDLSALTELTQPAVIGMTLGELPAFEENLWDETDSVDIALSGGETLASATREDVLAGANLCLIGDELLQFTRAQLLSPGVYRISGLLRGRLGTEPFTAHPNQTRFVLLNAAVRSLNIALAQIGQSWTLRAITFGASAEENTQQTIVIQGRSLTPYRPVQLRAVREASGDIALSWVRRARIDGSWRDRVDVPLLEQREAYQVEIYTGDTLLRRMESSSPGIIYSQAQQAEDFTGTPELRIRVAQISDVVGPGDWAQITLT